MRRRWNSPHPTSRRRARRGISLIDTLMAGAIMTAVLGVLISFSRFNHRAWNSGMASTSTQLTAELALERLAPNIRAARSVDSALSSSTRLTLQMPAYDGSGNLIVPLQNGNVVSYYLSDRTGAPGNAGDILWRTVNGALDSTWSLRSNGEGRVVLTSGGLSFSYYPSLGASGGPETVTVTVRAVKTTGNHTSDLSTSQEVVLRNRGY